MSNRHIKLIRKYGQRVRMDPKMIRQLFLRLNQTEKTKTAAEMRKTLTSTGEYLITGDWFQTLFAERSARHEIGHKRTAASRA